MRKKHYNDIQKNAHFMYNIYYKTERKESQYVDQ